MRWIVGDIHGMLRALDGLLSEARRQDPAATFYFVGDYVNRGPDSKGVVDLLLSLENAKFVRGNHDDVFDLVVNAECFERHPDMPTQAHTFVSFLQFGLDRTLTSYGIDFSDIVHVSRRPSAQNLAELVEAVPQSHRAFFRSLAPFVQEQDFFVAHARLDPDDPIGEVDLNRALAEEQQLRHQILWGRFTDEQIGRPKRWKTMGYFGHTPVSHYARGGRRGTHLPVTGPKVVLLDTAAALSPAGRLTAFCHETQRFIQVDRAGIVVSEADE
jgi:serine/threonine protein phosphatase 1